MLALFALDELHVGCHTLRGVFLGEVVDAESVAMEASQCDELPAIAELRQIPDEGSHLVIGHARGIPIEGWAVVVGKHLVWHHVSDSLCELLCLAHNWLASFHPNRICIRRPRKRALNAELRRAFDAIVAPH